MNDNLKFALQYAELGYAVYPVWGIENGECLCRRYGYPAEKCRKGKHPYNKVVPHGGQDATTDEAIIREWFKGRLVNVGIRIEDFCTLDVENRNGGMERLADWQRQYGELKAPTAKSGGGGRHPYLKRHPSIGTSPQRITFAKGVELLVGGEVIVPPSNHWTGGQYQWLTPLVAKDQLPEMPDWLVKLVVDYQTAEKQRTLPFDENYDPLEGTISTGRTFASLGRLSSGQRNDPVNDIIGSMVGHGYSREQILKQGIKWANEQEPPYSIRDLENKVNDFGKERWAIEVSELEYGELEDNAKTEKQSLPFAVHRSSFAGGESESLNHNTTPVEEASGLPDATYYGLLGEYLRVVEPLTEAHPAGVLGCLLAGIGNVLGRRLHGYFGRRHSGNLFMLLIGSTGSRKGTCRDVAESLLSVACPDWHSACNENGFGSGQGFVDRIRDAAGDDAGVPDKRLLVIEEEYAKPLRLCRSETSILSPLIRSAFDGSPLSVLNRGQNRYQCREPQVSIIGMITPEELLELTKGRTELLNGSINRFLLVECRRQRYLPSGGDYRSIGSQFSERLTAAIETAITDKPLSLSNEAAEVWNAEYRRLEAERPGNFGKAVARLSVHCLKVAMIYAALDGSPVIGLPHLRAALAFVDYCERSARSVFGGKDNPPDGPDGEEPDELPPHARLYDMVKGRQDGITKTDGYRLFGNKMKAEELNKWFSFLEASGFVVEMDGRWYASDRFTGVCGSSDYKDSGEPLCEPANGELRNDKPTLGSLENPSNDALSFDVRSSQFADRQSEQTAALPDAQPNTPTPVEQSNTASEEEETRAFLARLDELVKDTPAEIEQRQRRLAEGCKCRRTDGGHYLQCPFAVQPWERTEHSVRDQTLISLLNWQTHQLEGWREQSREGHQKLPKRSPRCRQE